MTPNEKGTTCLHGGQVNGSFQEWTILQSCVKDGVAKVGLTLVLPEDLEGFPGNRIFSATYRLDMTNHAYFNFTGNFSASGLGQRLYVAAPAYMVSDELNLPVELAAVDGTPFDYREGRILFDAFESDPQNAQIQKARGLDHAFDVRKAAQAGEVLAELSDPASGRGVRIKSPTGRCVVVYSGGFIDDSYTLAGGAASCEDCAVALECQSFPNAVNMPQLNPRILEAGGRYRHRIEYEFFY